MYVVWVGRGPYFWQCKGCTQPYMRLKDSAVDRSVFPVAGFRHWQNVSSLSYFICILYPFKQLCEHIAAGIKFTNIQWLHLIISFRFLSIPNYCAIHPKLSLKENGLLY